MGLAVESKRVSMPAKAWVAYVIGSPMEIQQYSAGSEVRKNFQERLEQIATAIDYESVQNAITKRLSPDFSAKVLSSQIRLFLEYSQDTNGHDRAQLSFPTLQDIFAAKNYQMLYRSRTKEFSDYMRAYIPNTIGVNTFERIFFRSPQESWGHRYLVVLQRNTAGLSIDAFVPKSTIGMANKTLSARINL